MTRLTLVALAATCLLGPGLVPAQDAGAKVEHGFLNAVYKDADGKEVKYVVFVPHDYKGDQDYPLILFLHGAGETGTDGKKQVGAGLGPAIKKKEKTFPFL